MVQTRPKDLHSHPINDSQGLSLSVGNQANLNTHKRGGGRESGDSACLLQLQEYALPYYYYYYDLWPTNRLPWGDCVKPSPFSHTIKPSRCRLLIVFLSAVKFQREFSVRWPLRTAETEEKNPVFWFFQLLKNGFKMMTEPRSLGRVKEAQNRVNPPDLSSCLCRCCYSPTELWEWTRWSPPTHHPFTPDSGER